MKPRRRTAYLQALGVEVWVPKAALVASPSRDAVKHVDPGSPALNEIAPSSAALAFRVEPGTSDTLLLCGSEAEARTVLAGDISRSLKVQPVWGWAVPGSLAGGMALEQVIHDRLITRLIIFGNDVCAKEWASAGGDGNASVIGTAEALRVASLPQLASSGKARSALWEALNVRQWCAARARAFSLRQDGEVEG